jgi:hypothetical protein
LSVTRRSRDSKIGKLTKRNYILRVAGAYNSTGAMSLTALSTFVDGFPADPAQPDYASHAIIDGELRNCQALTAIRATNGLLYPAYFAAGREARAAWLGPALRRFVWNGGRQPWDGYLRGLLQLLISPRSLLTSEQDLLSLAQLGPQLESSGARQCHVGETIAARLKKRKGPLPPELVDAVQTLVAHLVGIHSHGETTFYIAWRLWRAPENPHDGAPCYSARIRADLRAMRKREAAAWSAFLNLLSAGSSRISLNEPYAGALRDAVTRIGSDRFASQWKSWIDWMDANQPAALSPVGRDLLLGFLHACGADPALAMDEALYQLCAMRWAGTGNYLLTKEWLGALLVTLATRPAQKAFACAERLVHNPDTSAFIEVHKLYSQLLAEVAGEGVQQSGQPGQHEGVDGYDLACEPDLYRQQVILDHCLRDALPRGPGGTPGVIQTSVVQASVVQNTWHSDQMVPLLIRRQAEADHANFVRAASSRARWLKRTSTPAEVVARHQTPLGGFEVRGMDPYLFWQLGLDNVQRILLKAKPALGHDDLLALMETDISASAGGTTAPLLSLVSDYTREHGYSLAMVQAIERWRAAQHGSFGALDLRHKIGWLLWLEDVAPIREQDCWSQRIRKDVRQMPPGSRSAWRAILQNTSFAKSRQPAKQWEKQAQAALAGVSGEEFRQRVRGWFEPFRAEEPLHLTVCGRDVLRNLMWYALLAKDPQVDEAIAWFASAEWRNKRDRSCSESILPAFTHAMLERSAELAYAALETFHRRGKVQLHGKVLQLYRELCARFGRSPSAQASPKPPQPVLAGALPAIFRRFADPSKVRMENDRLVVSGARATYEIDVRCSRIVRRSDGRTIRLELDFSQPAFSMLRPMLDSQDLNDPFRPNYFRLMICALVLVRDDINAQSIVAESA